jgi:hypothetical protein
MDSRQRVMETYQRLSSCKSDWAGCLEHGSPPEASGNTLTQPGLGNRKQGMDQMEQTKADRDPRWISIHLHFH